MFQVLIVDDESSVIQSLMEMIPWEELGLEVAATALNSQDALQLAKREHFDIALLDIRMPGGSGLELCEKLKQENMQLQVIIISGYAEFAYAEKAIQYGVIGYCLKPLEETQIIRYLRRAAQNLCQANHMLMYEEIMELLESGDSGKIKDSLERLGLMDDSYYIAASFGDKKVGYLAKRGVAIRLGKRQWGYLLRDRPSELAFMEWGQDTGWQGIGWLKEPVAAAGIYAALEECAVMSCQFFVDKADRICCNIEEGMENRWLDDIVCAPNESSRRDMILQILEKSKKGQLPDMTARDAMRLCNMILTLPGLLRTEDYYIYSLEQLVAEYGTLENMLDMLGERLKNNDSKEPEGAYGFSTFMQLIRYVNANYREGISLSSAAEALHISPNYISQLFKKETGVNFVHYINQKRLEDAKKLLNATQKPVTEIAVEVGFNDYFYFMKTFKKIVGVTPGQYRAEH